MAGPVRRQGVTLVRGAGQLRRSRRAAGSSATRAPPGMDITAGEYGYDLPYFRRMLDAGAVDCLQADVTRCGGITRLPAGRGARRCALPRSLRAHRSRRSARTPAAGLWHLRHLEYFADHVRVESMLFDGVLEPVDGSLQPDPDRPGLGIEFKRRDAERVPPMTDRLITRRPALRRTSTPSRPVAISQRLDERGAGAGRGAAPTRSRARCASTREPGGLFDRLVELSADADRRGRSADRSMTSSPPSPPVIVTDADHQPRRRHQPGRPVHECRGGHRLLEIPQPGCVDRSRRETGRGRARMQPRSPRDRGQAHGLTFGPDPATHDRNTLGGMIGNNSCGVHSVMAEFFGPGR